MMTENEVLASLRVAICVAKADGVLQDEERSQIENALEGVKLPQGATLASLLGETNSIDALLKEITSPEARDACYTSAYAMAYADGTCSPEEQKLLDQIKSTLHVSDEKSGLVNRVFGEVKDTVLPSNIKKIEDPKKRASEINEDTLKYSILAGALGLFPIPVLSIFTDLAAVGLQIKLVRDIGQYYGYELDKKAVKELFVSVGLGTGARLAFNSLFKFVPVLGSAVGAASNFASTYAVGRMAVKYFESGCRMDLGMLKQTYTEAQKEGKLEYEKNKAAIEAKQKANEAKIKQLAEQRKAGTISEEEYEKKVAELA